MSTNRPVLILIALAASALSGCASIPKSACQSGAWYDIGMRDGASGRTEDRFLDHAQACAKHGLPADRNQWLLGRERGLERYCTARNGVAIGESNSRYAGVCPLEREQEFLRGYDVGRDLHEARSRLAWLDGEMHRIRVLLEPHRDQNKNKDGKQDSDKHKHDKPLSDGERIALAYQLGMHAVERERLAHEVFEIEQVARRIE
jgi:hypothetical protein